MCTFQDEQTVLVCDVAISRVRKVIDAVLGDAVQYTTVDGHGTLVEAPPTVDAEQFQILTRAAIATAQNKPGTFADQER